MKMIKILCIAALLLVGCGKHTAQQQSSVEQTVQTDDSTLGEYTTTLKNRKIESSWTVSIQSKYTMTYSDKTLDTYLMDGVLETDGDSAHYEQHINADGMLSELNGDYYGGRLYNTYNSVNYYEDMDFSNLKKTMLVPLDPYVFEAKDIYICKNKVAKPRVFIPVFPGTNSEYDLERAFNREGGLAKIGVFNNLSHSNILSSIDNFVKEINNSQILMLPGGFSAGDEPDGSAKFMVAVLKNKKVKEAVENLLKRDGLILGICNGFQALIKSGLLPYGEICELNETSPTLTFNTIDKHMSKIVQTKIITNNSPWLADMKEGDIHSVAISHGEGRIVITEEEYKKLFKNNQIATKYVDLDGNSTMDSQFNPNGSYYAIEGMLAYNGRIFGKMGHSERKGKNVYKNIYGDKEQNIFRNGIKFFK